MPARRRSTRRSASASAAGSATTSSRCGSPSALNLTHEVRNGILTHTGEEEPETLEGKIVRIVDRVAYINHDIDDAIRYGILAERRPSASARSTCSGRPARGGSTRSSAT